MIAEVKLWGRTIGAVSLEEGREVAAFQYDPDFARSGIELSPLVMPLSERVYEFPALPRNTFHGLPGLLADSLPDKFGNTLIDGSEHFMMDLVLFGMVVIGLVGWSLNALARIFERRMQRLYGIDPR